MSIYEGTKIHRYRDTSYHQLPAEVIISPELLSLFQNRVKKMTEDKKSPNSNSIPSWQHAEPSTIPSDSRDSLLDLAATFLLNDSVRDAPLDRKRSFLQSKGLNNDEIDKLLRVPENETPSRTKAEIKNQIPEVRMTEFENPKSSCMLNSKAVYPDSVVAERKHQGHSAAVLNGTFSFIP